MTPEWLSTVLGAPVRDFQTEMLEGGHLSDNVRLQFAVSSNAYTKETRFLNELAAQVPIKTPEIYGCFTDGSPASAYFIIVMEDLTSHSKVFDQLTDPPDDQFAAKIVGEAAEVHAKF